MLHVRAGAPQRGRAELFTPLPPLDQSRKLIIHPRVPLSAPAADVISTPALLPVDCVSSLIHKSIQTSAKIPGYGRTKGNRFHYSARAAV